MNANDSLHGNGNTLAITDSSGPESQDVLPTGVSLAGIATVTLTTSGNAGSDVDHPFDLSGVTGLTSAKLETSGTQGDFMNVGSASAVNAIAHGSSDTLSIAGNSLTSLSLAGTFSSVDLVDPTGPTSLTVNVSGAALTGGLIDSSNNVTSLTIHGDVSTCSIASISDTALTSLTVSGGSVTFGTIATPFSTDASLNTIDLTADTNSNGTNFFNIGSSQTLNLGNTNNQVTDHTSSGGITVNAGNGNNIVDVSGHSNDIIRIGADADYADSAVNPNLILKNAVPGTTIVAAGLPSVATVQVYSGAAADTATVIANMEQDVSSHGSSIAEYYKDVAGGNTYVVINTDSLASSSNDIDIVEIQGSVDLITGANQAIQIAAPFSILTTANDRIDDSSFVGAHTYSASIGGASATLNNGDSLKGNGLAELDISDTSGATSQDTLSGITLSGIEAIHIDTSGNVGRGGGVNTFDVSGVTGLTDLTVTSSGTLGDWISAGSNVNVTLNSVSSVIYVRSAGAVTIHDNHLTTLDLTLAVGGSGGVALNDSQTSATINVGSMTLTGGLNTDNHIVNMIVSGSGSLSKIDAINDSALSQLTVSGPVTLGSLAAPFALGDNVSSLNLTGVSGTGTSAVTSIVVGGTGASGAYSLGSRNVVFDMNNTHSNAVVTVGLDGTYNSTAPAANVVLKNIPTTVQLTIPQGAINLTHNTTDTTLPDFLATTAAHAGSAYWSVIGGNTFVAESTNGSLSTTSLTLVELVGVHNPLYNNVTGNIVVG